MANTNVEKGWFETAWDGICDAPTESKILAGVGAAVISLGLGVGAFFGGKAVGSKCADDFDPTKKEENAEEKKEEQPQPEQHALYHVRRERP